jgi:5-bromo-4-chloroindolyl phosphate hydrolysis protein
MTRREERVAQNEATSRDINEDLEEAHEGAPPDRFLRMVCECGRDSCDRVIAITIPEYQRVRSDPRRFAVMGSHLIADMEDVVDETDRFVVVRKREGVPADVASEEDPRS